VNPYFLKHAINLAPAQHKRAFRSAITSWHASLSADDKQSFEKKLAEGSKRRAVLWTALARRMLDTFYQAKEGVS
jgi:hypothetical protein